MAIVAIFVATLTGLGFSWTGVWVLPKCRYLIPAARYSHTNLVNISMRAALSCHGVRYGDPECYFKVNLCATDSSR